MPVMESIILVAGFILIIGAVLVLMKQNSMDPKIIVPLLLVLLILGSVMPSTIFNAELTPSGTPTPTPTPTATPIPFMPISGCGEINESGYYQLTGDFNAGLAEDEKCINFTANDIYVDCDGNEIDGGGNGIAFYLRDVSNSTILNCNMSNMEVGIYADQSNLSRFDNNSFYNFSIATGYVNILIEDSNTANVTGSNFYLDPMLYGIVVDCDHIGLCDGHVVYNNTMYGSGISLGILFDSVIASTITDNNFDTVLNTISIYDSGLLNIDSNQILDPTYGISEYGSNIVLIRNNEITGASCSQGMSIVESNYSWLYNNTINAPCEYGIYMETVNFTEIELSNISSCTTGIGLAEVTNSSFYNNTVTLSSSAGIAITGTGPGVEPSYDNDFIDNAVSTSGVFDFYCGSAESQIDGGNICSSKSALCGVWLVTCP